MNGIGAVFFFSSRRRHTRWTGDWSSDVCSSDLHRARARFQVRQRPWRLFEVERLGVADRPAADTSVDLSVGDISGLHTSLGRVTSVTLPCRHLPTFAGGTHAVPGRDRAHPPLTPRRLEPSWPPGIFSVAKRPPSNFPLSCVQFLPR